MAMATMRNTIPFTDASTYLDNPVALQKLAQDEGYLFFRGLLDKETLQALRREILLLCHQHGWLDPDWPLMDGIAKPGHAVVEGANNPEWCAFYQELLRMRSFHALAMNSRLTQALSTVFGEPALPHSRNICRVVFPGTSRFTTPPHQDHWYIGGTKDSWTTWIPLGDCPEELGALSVLPGSHKLGVLPMKPADGAGGNTLQNIDDEAQWCSNGFECGDVLTFHSLTVHQGRDNKTQRQLRVSVDYRFQPRSHPIRKDSMEPHYNGLGQTWDEIYADWPKDDPLRYYWRDMGLSFVER